MAFVGLSGGAPDASNWLSCLTRALPSRKDSAGPIKRAVAGSRAPPGGLPVALTAWACRAGARALICMQHLARTGAAPKAPPNPISAPRTG